MCSFFKNCLHFFHIRCTHWNNKGSNTQSTCRRTWNCTTICNANSTMNLLNLNINKSKFFARSYSFTSCIYNKTKQQILICKIRWRMWANDHGNLAPSVFLHSCLSTCTPRLSASLHCESPLPKQKQYRQNVDEKQLEFVSFAYFPCERIYRAHCSTVWLAACNF